MGRRYRTTASGSASDERAQQEPSPAVVVFVNDSSLRWLRCLRSPFRHCFVAVQQDECWVICDPLSHRTDLLVIGRHSARQLAHWYREHGLIVVETCVRPAPMRLAPIRPFTCVEAVKRVLGIHARWVLTPWQLYRLLAGDTSIGQ